MVGVWWGGGIRGEGEGGCWILGGGDSGSSRGERQFKIRIAATEMHSGPL